MHVMNAPPERRNHTRSAAPPHRCCGACRSRISRDARSCASSSNAAATREEAPRPAPPPARTPVACMMQAKKTWAPFPSSPALRFKLLLPSFLPLLFFFLRKLLLLMVVRGSRGGPRWIGGFFLGPYPAQSFHHYPSGRGSDFP